MIETAYDLRKYLGSPDNRADTTEEIYRMANELKEDIDYFTLFAKRNKISGFQFEILPSKGLCRYFLQDLYRKSNFASNMQSVVDMIVEYKVVDDLMKFLNLEGDKEIFLKKDIEKIADIYDYFKRCYNMDLRDYVTDFISCSRGCHAAINQITKVVKSVEADLEHSEEPDMEAER